MYLYAFQKTKEITVLKCKGDKPLFKTKESNTCGDRALIPRHLSLSEQPEVGTGSLSMKSGQ